MTIRCQSLEPQPPFGHQECGVWIRGWPLRPNLQLSQDKSEDPAQIIEVSVSPRGTTMSCTHVVLSRSRLEFVLNSRSLAAHLAGSQVAHTGIVQTASDHHGGIVLSLDVVVGRIRQHVIKDRTLVGIPPLFVFGDGQWQLVIHHRIDHIDKGHLATQARKSSGRNWSRLPSRDHLQSPCNGQLSWGRPPFRNQMLGGRNEVRKGVLLVEKLAIKYHCRPISEPPRMWGNGKGQAPIQQAHQDDRKSTG